MGLASNVTYGLANSSGTYYCKWIYGDDNLVAILGAVGMIPTILGFALVGPMNKKLGVIKTLRVSFFIGMAANSELTSACGAVMQDGINMGKTSWGWFCGVFFVKKNNFKILLDKSRHHQPQAGEYRLAMPASSC